MTTTTTAATNRPPQTATHGLGAEDGAEDAGALVGGLMLAQRGQPAPRQGGFRR